MSLVNDMLRDLDRRKHFPGDGGRINGLIGSGSDEVPRSGALLLPALIALSVLAGLGGGYVLFGGGAPGTPVAPIVPEPLAAAPEVHQLQAAAPAPRLEIADVDRNAAAFSLRLRGNTELGYAITDRSSTGMTIRFDGVKAWDNGGQRVEGLSVIQMPDHTLVELNLERDADIELFEDSSSPEFDLVLAATWRKAAEPAAAPVAVAQLGSLPVSEAAPEAAPAPVVQQSVADTQAVQPVLEQTPAQGASHSSPPQVTEPALPTRRMEQGALPQRVARGLTLDQQDRNNSQAAVSLVQSGRLVEAYEKLLTFITQNPQAHVSRETLGTILVAQQEFPQATLVVEEGLRLAPNYAPYKKIKARLLLIDGRADEALQLLQVLPPAVQVDREYHELLANLYQQAGDHSRAITTYQELLRTNGNEGRWWAGMGISLEAQGDTQRALASYQAALQQASLDPNVRQYSQNRISSLQQ